MNRNIYPEVHVPCGSEPKFPKACPVCGAKQAGKVEEFGGGVRYACGGAYTSKPQIQNHTDKWWGLCKKA